MSKTQSVEKEHGTTQSYVIGFLLSLAFTAIPYYMVVNKSFEGTSLLVTIMGFAVLQMLIQIFFFLHLGRGPKPLYNIVFFVSTIGIILIVAGGSVFIMDNLYRNMTPAEITTRLAEDEGIYQIYGTKTGACQGLGMNHKVTITNGVVSPHQMKAKQCDTLTFINEDKDVREITFGAHPNHGSYGGEYEVVVRKGRAKAITLNQTGKFEFHDHLDPTVTGEFSVQP